MAAKKNPDKFESYTADTVGHDGTVKRKTLYRPKQTLQKQSTFSSTQEMSPQDRRTYTGRSTLLGG